jgi:hypothetical protein
MPTAVKPPAGPDEEGDGAEPEDAGWQVGGGEVGRDCRQHCGHRVAADGNAREMARLRQRDEQAGGGDEPGDDRVRLQVGEEAEPEHAHRHEHQARPQGERERGLDIFAGAGVATLPAAVAVISEMTATGPTARVRELPPGKSQRAVPESGMKSVSSMKAASPTT